MKSYEITAILSGYSLVSSANLQRLKRRFSKLSLAKFSVKALCLTSAWPNQSSFSATVQ